MLKNIELLSKTKYSNVWDLIEYAKTVAVDNTFLQISIENYIRTGSEFDLEVIIDAVEFYETLK